METTSEEEEEEEEQSTDRNRYVHENKKFKLLIIIFI